MNWERRALEKIVLLLIEKNQEFNILYDQLKELGVELNINEPAYKILNEITDLDYLLENLDGVHDGHYTKEGLVEILLENIEKQFSL